MAQSIKRKIRRGNLRVIWNGTTQKLDMFRKSSKGAFILNNGVSDLSKGPGYPGFVLDNWEKK